MKKSAVKWLYAVTGKKKRNILLLMLMQAVLGFSGVLYALLLQRIVDSAVAGSGRGFRLYAGLFILLVLMQILLRACIRTVEEGTRAALENLLKKRLFAGILRKDFGTVSAVHSGEWMNRMTGDAAVTAQNCTDILPGMTGMLVKIVSAAGMMLLLEPRLALVMLPAGAVFILAACGFRGILKRLHKNIQEKDGKLRVFLQERIGSLMMVRAFAAEPQTALAADEKMAAHKQARMKRMHFSNLCNIGFQTGMYGMYAGGVIYCGFGILHGTVSFGTLTAVTQLIAQIQAPFAGITGFLPKLYAMTASAERLMEIEAFADAADIQPMSAAEIRSIYENSLAAIGLSHADFSYPPASDGAENMPAVLRDFSVTLRRGSCTAFTGQSGCGKSTVMKLLMCLYRLDGGSRFVTRRSGEREELTAAYHRLFAYVPQGNQLMSGSIREIVSFADPAAAQDDERIAGALKIACADTFVAALPDGTDTLLGERGTGLSEGQMQRIAIARAIFSGCPVLLLDEATAALDAGTERQLLENLRQMTDKTVVIVTHRPAALEICDRILEFTENGVTEKLGAG